MRTFFVALLLTVSLCASAQPRTIAGGDLGSGRIVQISSGDLGSGRIVTLFLVTPRQLELLQATPAFAAMIRRKGANHIEATDGYTLYGTPVRDGVADCTQMQTACYVVPDNPDATILIVNSGREEPR